MKAFMTQESKETVINFYSLLLGNLTVPHEELNINTRFGNTFVIAVGDKANPPIIMLHGSSKTSDELFYVIEGSFAIEFEDGLVSLSQGDMIVVPKGTLHRPVCTELVKCLLIELDGTLNDANTGSTYTKGRSA